MTSPVRNVELLERVMQHIQDHPEQHNQREWIENDCGTAACFAGWAVQFSDMQAVQTLTYGVFRDAAGGLYSTGEAAERVLGLTFEEALALFDARNGRHELALMVKDLVNGDQLLDRAEYKSVSR